MECLSDEGDTCCFDECFAMKSGIYYEEVFNASGVLNSITRDGTIGEEEIAVVKKSIATCEKKIKNSTGETCEIPLYVYAFTQCVFSENYKNCPSVKESLQCLEIGKLLTKCDKATIGTTKASSNPKPKISAKIKPDSSSTISKATKGSTNSRASQGSTKAKPPRDFTYSMASQGSTKPKPPTKAKPTRTTTNNQ
jgi:hypothetical protein